LELALTSTLLFAGCGAFAARTTGLETSADARARVSIDGPAAALAATGIASGLALADATSRADVRTDVRGRAPGASVGAGGGAHASTGGGVEVVEHGDPGGPEIVEANGEAHAGAGGLGTGYDDAEVRAGGSATVEGRAAAHAESPSQGLAASGEHVGADARIVVTGGASGEGGRVAAGAPAPSLGGGAGVRAVGRGSAHLGALLEAGLNVDGELLTLDQIGPLGATADVDASAAGHIAGDGALDAWVSLEHDQLARDGGETNLIVRARGGRAASSARGRLRVHLVLDRSSSMQSSWREVIAAARMLVARLSPSDEIQIVAYGTHGEEVVALRPVGDGRLVLRALDRIRVGGGTHIEAGLSLAYQGVARAVASDNDRSLVILVSDGVPTEGSFDAEVLAGLAARARAQHGCKTTVIGLGSQFDAEVLLAISREGRGGYHLARTAHHLAPVLEAELRAEERVAARDVAIDVRLPAGVTLAGSLDASMGLETTRGGVRLTLPRLASGEERTFVVGVHVDGNRLPRKVADIDVAYRVGGTTRRAHGDAWISFGAGARPASTGAGVAVLDAELAGVLAEVGQNVRNGNRGEAVAQLRAHVTRVEGRVEHRRSAPLARRTRAVAHLATALDALMVSGTYEERREVGLALGALAVRFGR